MSNSELWRDLIGENVEAPSIITLTDFWLSDWFPLRPGLYHTSRGQANRDMARRHLLTGPGVNDDGLQEFERILHRSVSRELIGRLRPESTYVYDPYGKSMILNGGVGCVRLKPKHIPTGEVWFIGASSTPVAHQGIPVALPTSLYGEFKARAAGRGYLRCTLTGQLMCIPAEFDPLYRDLVGIPQVYVQVNDLSASSVQTEVAFRADGVVTVLAPPTEHPSMGSWDIANGIFAAFVSFDPGKKGSIEDAAQWLAETYAGELLNGRVITDFDERTRRFSDTTFSLEQVMCGNIPLHAAETILQRCQPSPSIMLQFTQRIETVNGEVRNINISSDRNVVGDRNVVAYEGGAAAGPGAAAAADGSAAAVRGAAAAGRSSARIGFAERAKNSLMAKIAGLIALLAMIAATALLIFGVTDLGIAGYIIAVISVIVGIIPLLSA
jgi:hypothetical protein